MNWYNKPIPERFKSVILSERHFRNSFLNADIYEYAKPNYRKEPFKLSFYFLKGMITEHVTTHKTFEDAEKHLLKVIEAHKESGRV